MASRFAERTALVSVRPFCPGRGVSVLRPLRSLGEGRFRACGTCGNELVTLKVYRFGFIAEVYRGEPMGRGPGWLERAILDLLGINEYLSAPLLAAKAYTAYAPDAPDPPPDEAIDPTPAQRAAVRRALSKLQKRGLVVKLGSRYPGERCSYADREHALTIVRKEVQHLGLQSLRHYPRRVQELYADEIARKT